MKPLRPALVAGRRLRVLLPRSYAEGEAYVRARLPEHELVLADQGTAEFLRALQSADVVICVNLAADELAEARQLRLVHTPGAGVDRIAVEALPAGCLLCNSHGHEQSIAEWVLMSMLALSRRMREVDAALRQGEWNAGRRSGRPQRDLELSGRTVGLVGFGPIGRRVAELARGLGMHAIAVTRSPDPGRAQSVAWLSGLHDLHRLFGDSDFAVACLPLTAETRGMIGEEELKLLGNRGYLINVARGAIVKEEALYEALRKRTIAGAAIDVWYRYPAGPKERVLPSTLPFWELDNVIMSPHSSGSTESSAARRWSFVAEQLARFAAGGSLENVVARGAKAT